MTDRDFIRFTRSRETTTGVRSPCTRMPPTRTSANLVTFTMLKGWETIVTRRAVLIPCASSNAELGQASSSTYTLAPERRNAFLAAAAPYAPRTKDHNLGREALPARRGGECPCRHDGFA